jgi:hypothetical protein
MAPVTALWSFFRVGMAVGNGVVYCGRYGFNPDNPDSSFIPVDEHRLGASARLVLSRDLAADGRFASGVHVIAARA